MGSGTQVPGLQFPGRRSARLPHCGSRGGCRHGRGGSGAARGAAGAAGFAGPEGAGGARQPRGRRFPAGRSAAAGRGCVRFRRDSRGAAGRRLPGRCLPRPGPCLPRPGPARRGPVPPAGNDRGPGAAGEALTGPLGVAASVLRSRRGCGATHGSCPWGDASEKHFKTSLVSPLFFFLVWFLREESGSLGTSLHWLVQPVSSCMGLHSSRHLFLLSSSALCFLSLLPFLMGVFFKPCHVWIIISLVLMLTYTRAGVCRLKLFVHGYL